MARLVAVWFISIFLEFEKFTHGQFYFDSNYAFPSHVRSSRQSKNVRFGYQNPIMFAPILPAYRGSTTESSSIEKSEENSGSSIGFHETGERNEWDGTLGTSNTDDVENDYVSVFLKHDCPTGYTNGVDGNCILKNSLGYLRPSTSSNAPQTARTSTVQFGHQNPILVAPTLGPNPSNPPSHRATLSSQKWSSTTDISTTVDHSPCDQDSENHRRDRKTNRCYPLGSVMPCGGNLRNMAFYANPTSDDNIYGECDCILQSSRPLVYHPKTDTCYFMYQQAYCPDADWLMLTDKGEITCVHNPCWLYGQMVLNWNWTRNSNTTYMNTEGIVPVFEVEKCVPLGQICHRHTNGTLLFPEPPGEPHRQYQTVLAFQPGHLQPTCHSRNMHTQGPPPTNTCRPGSKSHVLGRCNLIISKSLRSTTIIYPQPQQRHAMRSLVEVAALSQEQYPNSANNQLRHNRSIFIIILVSFCVFIYSRFI